MMSIHRIAITLGVFLVCSLGAANAQPPLLDEDWQFPRATEVVYAAQCGASIAFRLGWRTEGRQVRYETFELSVGGRAALTAEQADRALGALNLLYERRRLHFSSPAVRCDLNRPVGTLMIYQSPDRLAQGSISLKVSIDGGETSGLLVQERGAAPVDALDFANR